MRGGGAGGSILNLGRAALDRFCRQATWDWRYLRGWKRPVGTWERVISFWCVEGMRAAFLEATLGEQRLASFAHGWEGERYSRREHNWGRGLEVESMSWSGE